MGKIEQIKKNKLDKQLSFFTLLVTLVGLSIVPLLIRVIPVDNFLVSYTWYGGDSTLIDMYSLFKSQIILLLGISALAIISLRQYKFKTYTLKDPIIILVILFSLVTLLSQLFSIEPSLSNRGMNDRFENTWVWISYLLIFTLVYGEKWSHENLKKLGFAFVISNVILSMIGILQYLGVDPVFNDFTKPFISSFKLGTLNFTANYSINYKVIVQTLYHYNYVGFYLSLSIPVILNFALYDKNKWHRVGYLALITLMLFNLLGSSARGGLVGVAAMLPFFVLLNRHLIFRNFKVLIAFVLIVSIVFVGFEAFTDGFITSRIVNIFTSVKTPNLLQDVTINDDSLLFTLDHGTLKVNTFSKSNDSWEAEYLYNDKNVPLILNEETNIFSFDLEQLKNIKVYPTQYNEIILLTFDIYGQAWHFAYDSQQQLKYVNPFGKFDDITSPNTLGFEGRERLGSARGYIWSRSLPLILDKPLLGYGIDTFSVVFPQQDYVGKYNAYGTTNMIVDKAHNLYIQIALNSGIIALLAYLGLVIMSFVKTGLLVTKEKFSYSNIWISATSLSIFSYSAAAAFNDSTVQLSSVMWIILALSLNLVKIKPTQL